MATPHISASMDAIRKIYNIKSISNLEYDIGLPLPRGLLYLRVKFDPSFPSIPPRIQVASNVIHPLINDKKFIICPELQNWQPKIPLLSIIQNIHSSFSQNPPVPDTEVHPNFEEILQNWNKNIDDEQDIIEFVNTLDEVSKLTKMRDELLEGNLEKVNENLRKKKEFDELLTEHQDEINEIESLTGQLAGLMKQVDTVNKQYSQEKVLEKLKEMEIGYNKQASEVQKAFLRKEIGTEEFIQQYQVPLKKAKFIQIAREGVKT
jgi:hypothetical protein